MKIDLGIQFASLPVQNQATGRFKPRSLFTGGYKGGFYDISDLTTLYSDTAGTTRAVVDGPVARINDKSGNGFHLSALSASYGTLRTSGSKYWLECATSTIAYSRYDAAQTAEILTIGMATSKTAAASYTSFGYLGTVGSKNFFMTNDAISEWRTDAGSFGTNWRENGAPGNTYANAVTTPHVTTAIKTSADNSSSQITLSSSNGSSDAAQGRIYAFFAISRLLTVEENANLESWLATKCGITFLSATASAARASSSINQIFEGLDLDIASGDALTITHSGCIVRNCRIRHRSGAGIRVSGANVKIFGSSIRNIGAPATGPEANASWPNIVVDGGASPTISGVVLKDGSSGIYLNVANNAILSGIEVYNARGPFPRGQGVQFNASNNGSLTDFYVYSYPDTAHTEDNISVYASTGVTILRGLIDGNDSPSGVGVMFESGSSTGTCTSVDTANMGNGAFSASGPTDTIFTSCRSKNQIGLDQGRGKPTSRGWNNTTRRNIAPALAFSNGAANVQFISCTYYSIPGLASFTGLTETSEAWETNFSGGAPPTTYQWTESNYTQRTPWQNNLAWVA